MNFLNYKPGSPFSSHILKSFKVFEKYSHGRQYPLNLQSKKDFPCSFVIKSNHIVKEGNTSDLQLLKPSCKQGLSSHIRTRKAGCIGACLINTKRKTPAHGPQYVFFF